MQQQQQQQQQVYFTQIFTANDNNNASSNVLKEFLPVLQNLLSVPVFYDKTKGFGFVQAVLMMRTKQQQQYGFVKFLESFLQNRMRSFEEFRWIHDRQSLKNDTLQKFKSGLLPLDELDRRVFMILYRLVSDPEASKLPLQEKSLLSETILNEANLLDIVTLFYSKNEKLVSTFFSCMRNNINRESFDRLQFSLVSSLTEVYSKISSKLHMAAVKDNDDGMDSLTDLSCTLWSLLGATSTSSSSSSSSLFELKFCDSGNELALLLEMSKCYESSNIFPDSTLSEYQIWRKQGIKFYTLRIFHHCLVQNFYIPLGLVSTNASSSSSDPMSTFDYLQSLLMELSGVSTVFIKDYSLQVFNLVEKLKTHPSLGKQIDRDRLDYLSSILGLDSKITQQDETTSSASSSMVDLNSVNEIQQIVPHLSKESIAKILRKANGNIELAIDMALNIGAQELMIAAPLGEKQKMQTPMINAESVKSKTKILAEQFMYEDEYDDTFEDDEGRGMVNDRGMLDDDDNDDDDVNDVNDDDDNQKQLKSIKGETLRNHKGTIVFSNGKKVLVFKDINGGFRNEEGKVVIPDEIPASMQNQTMLKSMSGEQRQQTVNDVKKPNSSDNKPKNERDRRWREQHKNDHRRRGDEKKRGKSFLPAE